MRNEKTKGIGRENKQEFVRKDQVSLPIRTIRLVTVGKIKILLLTVKVLFNTFFARLNRKLLHYIEVVPYILFGSTK